ncbi:MAG: O-antigen polysaccharide polymerase Wzy [Slackia sp.]
MPLACIVFATGYCFDDLYVALLGTVLMFTANIVFGCLRLRERLLFLFLHAGIALFLLTRPVIGTLDEDRTWMLSSPESTWFAITAIFVSLVFLFLGAVTYSTVVSFNERRRKERDELRSGIEVVGASEEAFGRNARGILGSVADLTSKLKHSERIRYIRTASLLCFLVCYVAALYEGYIKLSYMSGLAYEEYYLIDADEHVPWIIGVLRPMMLAFLLLSCVHAAPPSYGYLPCAVCFHYRAHADDLDPISSSRFVRGALLVLRAVTDTEGAGLPSA